ncbi:hypothetical protein CTZ28_34825 [Streptomyces shenzhenensis]|uniref:Uncharacterized protein n=1 Tax=Streptomyces shenzhenensis TaxID=943815 RepID=A0A3M0I5K2_9ACTN|nr:hypothetical protein CTZ28_34825 [Streptomyces shenzhenensis]
MGGGGRSGIGCLRRQGRRTDDGQESALARYVDAHRPDVMEVSPQRVVVVPEISPAAGSAWPSAGRIPATAPGRR